MMYRSLFISILVTLFISMPALSQDKLLIPMDASQSNHLKAYGIIFNNLQDGNPSQWLLNYQGGSFLTNYSDELLKKAQRRNVKAEPISNSEAAQIISEVEQQDTNTSVIQLDKAPKIAVYTPKQNLPWDDAVTLALTYAEVEFEKIWDPEVLNGELSEYDWLHLHHEDFTGQYGKFWVSSRNEPWYVKQVREMEEMARELGYQKVSNEKKAVAAEIKDYVGNGGFLFAMCSGTDTFDIALAAQDVDIAPTEFDGDPMDPNAQQKLNFENTLAFTDFVLSTDPAEYEHADIDVPVQLEEVDRSLDYFTLFEFSAKWDPVPSMLTQNHVSSIRGFYGQTTAFQKDKIKESVVVLGESPGRDMVKYIHGNFGQGTYTFYAGHDPEDYTHRVNDPPTDLSLHTSSPGYRLILNNILFPAAKKKKRKT
ncbi:MAG: asparagine synthetase B [Bacteroidota bacterium]